MAHDVHERWRAIQRLVDGALDRPPAERAAFLSQACGSDASLYDSAAHLLDACERAIRLDAVLGSPAAAFAAPMLDDLAVQDATLDQMKDAGLTEALRRALSPHYAVERELGRGGMATVYLARDLRHDRAVAIKVLDRNVASTGAERFLHEIRVAARLTHPHVLSVHDSGGANGLLYYVMPYVEGETLRARMAREGTLPLADATRIIRELADALAYAHARAVVHRDLKPENVLLSGGHAVVADFGIAKAIAAATQDGTPRGAGLTATGVALGTPAYMAPEQAVGDPATDHRADLYALGVLAYEVLAGAHPFEARTAHAFVNAHLTETPRPLRDRRPDIPDALATLVMRLLAKNPAERPQRADDVLSELDAAVPARPTPALPRPTSRNARRVWITVTALLIAAVMVGFAVRQLADRGTGQSSSAGIRTLAVLPFENTGGAAADDYFSDGMTDELAHALARLPGLKLAGRTSSYTFKGRAAPAQEIGRTLGVDAFVHGTVRRAGERLRVTTQLVSAVDGTVMRDSVFESRSGDVFAVQDSLTRAIVAALAPALGDRTELATEATSRGTANHEAYDLYLKGRYYFLSRDTDNITRAIRYFGDAVARDPRFARAHAGLALAYGILPVYVPDPADSTSALMSVNAERALALDSTLADAQVAMGLVLEKRLRLVDAEARYRAAIALEPSNATAHQILGFLLYNVGRTDEAIPELERASQLDPLSKSAAASAALGLIAARRFSEAMTRVRRALAVDSTFSLALVTLGYIQAFAGQPDSALLTLERGSRLNRGAPTAQALQVFAYAASGQWADADRIRAQLRRPGADQSGGVETALAELIFGDTGPALRLLTTETGRRRWYEGAGFGCNPLIDPLWLDARFRAVAQDVGAVPCPLAGPWQFPPRT